MRHRRLLDQGHDRRVSDLAVIARALAQIGHDLTAPFGFAADQGHILGQLGLVAQLARKFARHQLDRGERRAELMRRRRRDPADRRQPLLARQSDLGRGQRLGHGVALDRDPARIDRQEHDRDCQGRRHPGPENLRRLHHRPIGPDQRHVEICHQRNRRHRRDPQPQGRLQPQRGRRDGHRRQDQHREGVVQPAGHHQQRHQLRQIEVKRQQGALFG